MIESIPTWEEQYAIAFTFGVTSEELLEKLEFEKEMKLVELFANTIDVTTSIKNIDRLEETVKESIHYDERHHYLCNMQNVEHKRLK